MKIVSGKKQRCTITVVYGPHGVGKTTFAVQYPEALVLDVEDGCADLDVDRTPVLKTYDELIDALKWVYEDGAKKYKTIILDSIDHAELLMHRKICQDASVESLADIEWGKGKSRALKKFGDLLHMLSLVRDEHGVDIVVIAHDAIERVEDPETSSYDRHVPKTIIKDASPLLCEWADEVMYAHHNVRVKTEKGAFGKETNKALSRSERMLRTTYKPSVIAKNRLEMEEVIPFSYEEYDKYRSKVYA